MDVAVFTDNDFDKVNGVTTTLRAVLEHAPRGVNVRVYTASDRVADDPQYFSTRSPGLPIPFYREMRLYLPAVPRLRQAVSQRGADVVHLTTPGPVGLAAMRIARQGGLPLIGSFHTDLASYARLLSGSPRLGGLMRHYLQWPYGRCARVLAPSEATRQMLLRSSDDPARIELWSRGVDSGRFSPVHRDASLRRQWGVSAERPALLYVGRVSREKGLDLLPALTRALHCHGVSHRVVVVGTGPMSAELQAAMPDAVFTGVLHGERLAAAYASGDVFVFPSQTDTAGNVVLEAQASGLPVLVSAIGGPRENIVDGCTGHVVPEATVDSWLRLLMPLIEQAGRRERMRLAARRYAESRTWPVALEPLFRAYRELGARRVASSRDIDPSAPVSPLALHARLLPR